MLFHTCQAAGESLDVRNSIAYAAGMSREPRGLRFAFDASAEIAPENTPKSAVSGRVTELSLQGCFVETAASFDIHRAVLLKIFHSEEHVNAHATVLYLRATGVGLVFRDVKAEHRDILQKWVLKALDSELAAQ